MCRVWNPVVALASIFGLTAVALIVIGLAYLIYPAAPGQTRFLQFNGFIPLPSHGVFNALDYLTLRRNVLFVAGESSGTVFKVTLDPERSDKAVSQWPGEPSVHGVAMDEWRQTAFVTRSGLNVVDAFRTADLKPLARIPVADGPDSILYDRAHDVVYVANGEAGKATLIDATRRLSIGTIPLGGRPEFAALDPVSGLVYQNIFSKDMVAAVDLGQRKVVGHWAIPPCRSPTGIAIDGRSRRAFIVCLEDAVLVVFDLVRHTVVASIAIGVGPDSVAFDPSLRRIYAIGLAGRLTIIQQNSPNAYRVLDSITTHVWAHTLAVDPHSSRVYLGYAGLFVLPRIAVFTARL